MSGTIKNVVSVSNVVAVEKYRREEVTFEVTPARATHNSARSLKI